MTSASDGKERIRGSIPEASLYLNGYDVKAMPKVSSKNQITIPVQVMRAAGLRQGDEVAVRATDEGEIVLAPRASRVRRHAGIASGIYRAGEVDRLRDEWER